MPGLCVLCVAAALAALARLVGAAGPVVRCEPCDAAALLLCKPLPKECAERMREPGCGCCTTCALGEGQACGVYTARCGSGLTCQHQAGESRPLQALLEGRGACAPAASKKLSSILTPAQKPENGGNQVEEGCANATQTATVPPRRGDREGWTQSGLDGHQASAAQQADPEGSEQEEAELQGGVGVGRSQHGHAQLLPGEQEGDRVLSSVQRPEAGILLVRGQVRAAAAGPGRPGAGRDAVLQPGEQVRGRRDVEWTERERESGRTE
uniref:Insulin-like growth factor binding protein 3 n=1 Tax=Scophthalmus maximus TaxID=52904 RepID=A0A8D3B2K1_SCOMX